MSTKNINAFCETLEKSDWDFILEENDITKAFENLYSRINATADISFPLKHVKKKKIILMAPLTKAYGNFYNTINVTAEI